MELRLGKFVLGGHLMDNEETAPMVRSVMGCCIILRCEADPVNNTIVYLANSPCFDLCPDLKNIPLYTWDVNFDGPLGDLSIKAQRVTREIKPSNNIMAAAVSGALKDELPAPPSFS